MDTTHTGANEFSTDKTHELQRIEAEWVTRELEEFVKLLQRYRSLYLTAVFLAIGWVLSQALGSNSLANASFDSLRFRPDIAAVLCLIPFVNVLFGLLILEVTAQIQTLARYRFLLGFELGEAAPAWRWECWKSSKHGSIRAWTNPLNVLFTLSTVGLTVTVLWFSRPATRESTALAILWWSALSATIVVAVVVGILAFKLRHQNLVAAAPTVRWADLWPVP